MLHTPLIKREAYQNIKAYAEPRRICEKAQKLIKILVYLNSVQTYQTYCIALFIFRQAVFKAFSLGSIFCVCPQHDP